MGVTIKSTAVTIFEQDNVGSVDYAVAAGNQCIRNAGISRNDIDLLINVGIYKDDNVVEPATAALIQMQMEINLDPDLRKDKSTFCLDQFNGACGFIYGVFTADAILTNEKDYKVLIISSNVYPSKMRNARFPFTHSASAALLEHDKSPKGFIKYKFATMHEGNNGLDTFIDLPGDHPDSRHNIKVKIYDDFPERATDLTVSALREFIAENNIDVAKVKLLINHPFKEFAARVADGSGIAGGNVLDLFDKYGDTHSSALNIAFHEAVEREFIKENDDVLFVSVGSGISVAVALYKV